MSIVQVEALFTGLAGSPGSRLREVGLKAINLSAVKPDKLAAALARLDKVNLSFTELKSDQLTALFSLLVAPVSPACPTSSPRLRSVDFFSVDLSGTSPRLLGQATASLTALNLSNTELR